MTPLARKKWDIYRSEFSGNLRAHCARLTRLKMRRDRLVKYNRDRGDYVKLTVRWNAEQANILRFYSTTLRVSISRIVDFLLRTMTKEKAQQFARQPCGSYHVQEFRKQNEHLGVHEIYRFKPYLNLPP
ncbi:hypothetical protein [Turneriella parva]|uniref:hypothetical protein n=1 Tax=Turneriella parva TaxID=29510 RepID=UPI0012F6D32C|nr:hypothetical protein [Turneriella parva]